MAAKTNLGEVRTVHQVRDFALGIEAEISLVDFVVKVECIFVFVQFLLFRSVLKISVNSTSDKIH